MELTEEHEDQHLDAQFELARLGNYYQWILNNFGDSIGHRVWDAGAGIGSVTSLLTKRCDFVLATEYGERNLKILRQTFDGHADVAVDYCDLTMNSVSRFASYDLDTVISLDVLEHLKDDCFALKQFHRVLKSDGRVLIKVPAHEVLYCSIDEASLHYRRYSKSQLGEALISSGFVLEQLRYMNWVATIPYFIKGRLLKPRRNFSRSIKKERLSLYNQLMPWLERLERIVPPPFGLSVIAVGRKA